MALFCADIRRYSVSILKFSFLSHVLVFPWEMSLVSHLNVHRVVFPPLLSIFTKPSSEAGYDTRSIFQRGLTGLNSEFSFF